jgi:divalent metal cation (Fe/Co/Zn/Cd) transporter
MQQTAELLRRQQREDARRNRFEKAVSLLASIFVVPSVIAAIFEAMPVFFDESPETRAVLMIGLMALGGLITWFLLDRTIPRNAD